MACWARLLRAAMLLAVLGACSSAPAGGGDAAAALDVPTPDAPALGDAAQAGRDDAGLAGGLDAEDGAEPDSGRATPDAGVADAAELDPLVGLPACAGRVADAFTKNAIDPPASGSDAYFPPSEAALDALGEAVQALLAGDPVVALPRAQAAGYEICRGAGAESSVVLVRPQQSGRGDAVIAWRPSGRGLIVEAPHPWYDLDTLPEAWLAFEQLPARALVVSGAHRCSSLSPSGCDGTVTACTGTEVPVRASDAAHQDRAFFHVAHEALAAGHPRDLVVSLHGMGEDGVSASDGTGRDTTSDAPVARLTRELRARLPGETVTLCNGYPGASGVVLRLCGTTNVQGRRLNGSAAPCTEASSRSSSRFLHVEQSRSVRSGERARVVEALGAVLP